MTSKDFIHKLKRNYRYVYDYVYDDEFVPVADYVLKGIIYSLIDGTKSPSKDYREYFEVFDIKVGRWNQLRSAVYYYIKNNEAHIQLRML